MDLDFAKLNKLKVDQPGSSANTITQDGNKIRPVNNKKGTTGITDALDGTGRLSSRQDNIRQSSALRSEINKSICEGGDLYNVLLKAIECISVMTDDRLFYTGNKDKLQEIYGALENPQAVEQELQEVSERLALLKLSQEREPSTNIKQAIDKHIKKIVALTALQGTAS